MMEIIPIKLKSAKNTPLFCTMRYLYLKNSVKEGTLTFSEPSLWDDPFEKTFYKPDGVIIGGKKYFIACICFTYDPIEAEEAAWHRATPDSVRVEFSMEDLCAHLNNVKGYKFYFSIADYSMSRKDIDLLVKEKKDGRYERINEYLNCMSLKRKAFSYENEMRLFLVSKEPIPFCDGRIKISFPIAECIHSVCLPPKKPGLCKATVKADLNIKKVIRSRLYEL